MDGAVPGGAVLPDGAEVLAPDKEHVLRRGCIDDEAAAECRRAGTALPGGYRVVAFAGTDQALALPGGRLVPWRGYAARLFSGLDRAGAGAGGARSAGAERARFAVWRCELWTEGLFSALFWALGWLEAEARRPREDGAPRRLLVDWTDSRILFYQGAGAASCANAWNAFFEQPPPETPADGGPGGDANPERLEAAERDGRLSVTVRFGPPWFAKFGEFRGADEGDGRVAHVRGGRLDEATAREGRAAVGRWIRVRRHVLDRADSLQASLLPALPAREWLAVHLRRTDKLEQCGANRVERAEALAQVRAFAAALACHGVLLCTDDAELKAGLAADLAAAGLRVAVLDALLSQRGLPPHKDEALDRRRNAEDVLVEVLLMARCGALLSTYSNVSVAAVYFAPPGYQYFLFGDVPPLAPPEDPPEALRRCAACGLGQPALRCSRCRGAFFCGAACQRSAWRQHRPRCSPAGAAR